MKRLEEIWNDVRMAVCLRCIDAGPNGECRQGAGKECALNNQFELIVDAIGTIASPDIAPYAAAVRARVCSVCGKQSADGACLVRSAVDCALDRYLPLVVAAVEESRVAAA